jgi:transposase
VILAGGGPYQIYFATRPVDFRKGHAGLSLIVQEVLGRDPFSGAIYVFRSKRGDQLKCLVWDQTGLVLVYKKLEGGAFRWPKPSDGMIRLSPAQFSALFEGIDFRAVRAERRRRPRLAG